MKKFDHNAYENQLQAFGKDAMLLYLAQRVHELEEQNKNQQYYIDILHEWKLKKEGI